MFFIAGAIALSIAFGIVGTIFDFFGFYDSELMSDLHWSIRTIIFAFLTWVFIKVFEFFSWLLSFEWWVYLIASVCVVSIVVVVYILRYRYNKYKYNSKENQDNQECGEKNNEVIIENKLTLKDICPRCGGRLVKRHGPYGDFYGCSNYRANNCKYTRKFK